MNDVSATDTPQRVECPAAKDPAVRMFIVAAMFIGFVVYCAVDAVDKPPAWTLEHINPAIQYVLHKYGPFVFGAPGLLLAVWGVVFLRRKLVADDKGIGYLGKEPIPWGQVRGLDASRLKSKGILKLNWGDGGKLTLDSWKLQNFKALVAFVEQKIPQQAQAE